MKKMENNLTWNGIFPNSREFSQITYLKWILCVALLVFCTPYLWHYFLGPKKENTKSNKSYFRKSVTTSSCLVICLVELLIIATEWIEIGFEWKLSFGMTSIKTAMLILAFNLTLLEQKKETVSTLFLCSYWGLILTTSVLPFIVSQGLQDHHDNHITLTTAAVYSLVAIVQWIIKSSFESSGKEQKDDIDERDCPEVRATPFSLLFFSWMNKLFATGYKKTLTEEDVFYLNPRDMSKNVVPKFEANWEQIKKDLEQRYPENTRKDLSSQQKRPQMSLLKVLLKTFGLKLLLNQILYLIHVAMDLVIPYFIRELIKFAEGKEKDAAFDPREGLWLVASFFIMTAVQSNIINQFWHYNLTLGIRVKASIASAVYKKSLTISNQERKESTVGELTNLMSVDLDDVQHWFNFLWILVITPFQLCISLYSLYNTVGVAFISGLLFLIVLLPINVFMMKNLRFIHSDMKNIKDERIKLLTEVLNGIKILKLYAWEMAFKEKILAIRNKELFHRRKQFLMRSCMKFMHMAPYFVSLLTFATYIYISEDNRLDAQTIFVSAFWFEMLRKVLFSIPIIYTDILKATLALQRLDKFLNKKDIDTNNVSHDSSEEDAIKIKNGTFMWDPEIGNCLKNINFSVPEGSLVAIVGPVGAGKSSILASLMGEMEKVKGYVNVKGSVAYVPQQAWIQNTSLKNNILFGKTLKNNQYQSVIDACGLRSDLSVLVAGDDTEIGEKGINLSGGQKQRISLARAVYCGTDIYFLDDPLSAVDAHVGKHIFEKVIGNTGLLKHKTRILVTHGVQWLPKVDNIIVLDNGCISEMGTFDQLISHNGPFAKFLQTYLKPELDDLSSSDEEKKVILQRLSSITSDPGEDDVNRNIESDSKKRVVRRRKMSRSFSRSISLKEDEVKQKPVLPESKLINDESAETGNVKLSVYLRYIRAIGLTYFIIGIMGYSLYEMFHIVLTTWLSHWADDSILNDHSIPRNSTEIQERNKYYLCIYTMFGALQVFSLAVYTCMYSKGVTTACKVLHENLLNNVLRAPMSFFDTTPVGRIVHRFSKDVDVLDGSIPHSSEFFLSCLLGLAGAIFVVMYTTPWFAAFLVPLGAAYCLIQSFVIPTVRQLRRLESNTKSPIFSHFSETINGAAVIRAFSVQKRFSEESQRLLDRNQQFQFAMWSVYRWLGIRLDMVGVCVITAAAFFAVADQSLIHGGLIGLCISYAFEFTERINRVVRLYTELELNAVSIERINEYIEIPTEAELSLLGNVSENGWPHNGAVHLENYSTRYRAGLDLVLKNIDAYIKPGEKVGIVGRTGAGKSSLTLGLFRLIEPASGSIVVDDKDISHLGLHDCRSKLTILPQDPVLFSGTLKMNIDPLDDYTDEIIWEALEHAHLKSYIESLPGKLQYDCGEGGQNMSVGQRQLLCLARSLLRKTKVLVLDEATAAVDLETDDLIQETIRTEFKECTVLTIAHRLHTVIDYDRIMVLDQGEIKDFDSPNALLQKPDSIFYQLAKDAKLV